MRILFASLLLTLPSFAAVPAALTTFLDQHCTECHDSDVKKAGLDLTEAKWQLDDRASFDLWVKVHDRMQKGEMPPAKKPRPEAAELQRALRGLNEPLHAASAALQQKQGRTLARRLNRIEYENTLHDLLGIDIPLAVLLPEDTPMHGFDTVAEGLRFSQLQIEKYLEAADAALDSAADLRVKPVSSKARYSYKEEKDILKNLQLPDDPPADPKKKYSRQRQMFRMLPDSLVMFTDADYLLGLDQFKLHRSGSYRVRISASGYQSNGETVTLRLYANNYQIGKRLLGAWDMPADKPREVEVVTRINRGEHLMVLPFKVGYDADGKRLNDADTTKDFKGRGLSVQWVEIEGPIEASHWPPVSLTQLFPGVPVQEIPGKQAKNPGDAERLIGYELKPADPESDARRVVESFAARAFRRPLEPGEADRFVQLALDSLKSGADFLAAVKIGLRGVLTSPQFLLFDEAPGAKLSDHALASRLSYFLWSTLPDDELMHLAAENKLHDPVVLKAQVQRMIGDKRSAQFVKHFTGQWLDLRAIDATSPDPGLYPEFDEMLKLAMVGETESFVRELLQKDLPVTNFIQSDFLTLNNRISQHYGVGTDEARDEQFVRVNLPAGSVRGGVLTQASILKVTANGTTSSPVLRGAWVMKRLLGEPPPPPPPGISGVEPDTRGASTIRELLAKHRDSETCAGCHAKIDPPGFVLESFDVIGGFRERYRNKEKGDRPAGVKFENRGVWQYKLSLPVDPTGQFADGTAFKDIHEFKKHLVNHPEAFHRCLTEQLLTYGTGAAPTYADRQAIAEIMKKNPNPGLSSLITEVVLSDTFQTK
jgi:hypothetical protein